jgi:hypothetical protein
MDNPVVIESPQNQGPGQTSPNSPSDALHFPDEQHCGKRIGEALVDLGFAKESKVAFAISRANKTGMLTGQALISTGTVTGRQLAEAVAACSGLPFIDYEEFPVDENVLAKVNIEESFKHMAIPCARLADGRIVIAISDHRVVGMIDQIRTQGNPRIVYAVAQENDVYFMIKRAQALIESAGGPGAAHAAA